MATDGWVSTPFYVYIADHDYEGRLGKLKHHFMQGGKLENAKVWRSKQHQPGQQPCFSVEIDGAQLQIGHIIGRLLYADFNQEWYHKLKERLAKVGLTESD